MLSQILKNSVPTTQVNIVLDKRKIVNLRNIKKFIFFDTENTEMNKILGLYKISTSISQNHINKKKPQP